MCLERSNFDDRTAALISNRKDNKKIDTDKIILMNKILDKKVQEIISKYYPGTNKCLHTNYILKMLIYYSDKIPLNEFLPFINYNNANQFIFYEACHQLGWITIENHEKLNPYDKVIFLPKLTSHALMEDYDN
jgi:hypothetical protein